MKGDKYMKQNNSIKLLFSFVLCFSAAGIGSAFTVSAIPVWYAALNKPFFNPPNWLFGPVWTVLYAMMAIALFLIWSMNPKNAKLKKTQNEGLYNFYIQLALNTLWSIAFFGLKNPLVAFFIILALWLLIYLTIKNFLQLSKAAGQLLIPYLGWVSFATILNLSIVLLN